MGLNFGPQMPKGSLAILFDPSDPTCAINTTNYKNIVDTAYEFTAYNSPSVGDGYVEFDNTNDMLVFSSNQDFQKIYAGVERTMTVTCKRTTETGEGRIVSRPWNGSGQYNYQIVYQWNGGSPYVGLYLLANSGDYYNYETPTFSSTDSHTFTVTFGGRHIRIYLDGQYIHQADHEITTTNNQYGDFNTVTLGTLYPYGTWGGNEGFTFGGRIYHFSMYTRVLSEAEVISLHNNLKMRGN